MAAFTMKTCLVVLAGLTVLGGCARDESADAPVPTLSTMPAPPAPAAVARERLARGAQLFATHCAAYDVVIATTTRERTLVHGAERVFRGARVRQPADGLRYACVLQCDQCLTGKLQFQDNNARGLLEFFQVR